MENAETKVIDAAGTPLTPGSFEKCLGNGKNKGIECCCDNCDYFITCVLNSEAEEWQELKKELLESPMFSNLH